MRLPDCQNAVIEAVATAQKNTVVVLHNGSPVEMPWLGLVPSVLELYLGGQAVGEAAVSLLWGETNPSGKLAETFPLRLSDTPAFDNFPGGNDDHSGRSVLYGEGVFVGYRAYDHRNQDVLFPFGHGLSYTSFVYNNIQLDKKTMADTEILTVTVDVKNTGKREGKEIVQLYIEDKTGYAVRPIRELKGFEKVSLDAGETKTVAFTLDKRAFAYYNTGLGDWFSPSGEYEIVIGASSRDLRQRESVTIKATVLPPFTVDWNTTMDALLKDPRTAEKAKRDIGEKYFKLSPDDNDHMAALGSDTIWLERGILEDPLRYLYMSKNIPFEDIERQIAEFNELLR
jgi:beta-glucosidase